MIAKATFLCFQLLAVSVALSLSQTPGDADMSCVTGDNAKSYPAGWRVLLDSRNYENLLGGSRPAWRTADADGQGQGWIHGTGGPCERSVRVCDFSFGENQENWLFTQFIEYRTAKDLRVNVIYQLRECMDNVQCTINFLTAFQYEANENDSQSAQNIDNYSRLFRLNHPSTVTEVEVTFDIRRTADYYRGFYLGIRDIGSCGFIRQIIIYHIYNDEDIVPAPPQLRLSSSPIEVQETTLFIRWLPSAHSVEGINLHYHVYIRRLCETGSQSCEPTDIFTRDTQEPYSEDLDEFEHTVDGLDMGTSYVAMVVAFFASQTAAVNLNTSEANALQAQSLVLHMTTLSAPATSPQESPTTNSAQGTGTNALTMALQAQNVCTTATVLAIVLGCALLVTLVALCIVCLIVLYNYCRKTHKTAKINPDSGEYSTDGTIEIISHVVTQDFTATPAVHTMPGKVKLQSKSEDVKTVEKSNTTISEAPEKSKSETLPTAVIKPASAATDKQIETKPKKAIEGPGSDIKEEHPKTRAPAAKGTPLLPPLASSSPKTSQRDVPKETRDQNEGSPSTAKESTINSHTVSTASALQPGQNGSPTETKPKKMPRSPPKHTMDNVETSIQSAQSSNAKPPVIAVKPKIGFDINPTLKQNDGEKNTGSKLPPTLDRDPQASITTTLSELHTKMSQSEAKQVQKTPSDQSRKEESAKLSTEEALKNNPAPAVAGKPKISPKSPLLTKRMTRQNKPPSGANAGTSQTTGISMKSASLPRVTARKIDHQSHKATNATPPELAKEETSASSSDDKDRFSSLRKKLPLLPPTARMKGSRSDPNLNQVKQTEANPHQP